MKIPKFIKQLCKVCDTESSRYALGGIKVESDENRGSLTATDGRILCNVTFPDGIGPAMDMVIDGKQVGKAVTHCVTKDGPLSVGPGNSGPKYASITGANAALSVETIEGRFPKYDQLFDIEGHESDYKRIRLDPKLLTKLLDIYAAAIDKVDAYGHSKGVDFWFKGGDTSAVFMSYTTPDCTVIRSIIMPLEHDATEDVSHYPSEYGAADKPQVPQKPSKPQKQHTAAAAPQVDMSELDAIPVAPLS